MVGAWKRLARARLLSLLEYDLTACRTRAEKDTMSEEELGDQMDEARVKLESDSEDDVFCAWKLRAIGDVAYSGWKVDGGLGALGRTCTPKKPWGCSWYES